MVWILPQPFLGPASSAPKSSDHNHSSGKSGCEGVRGPIRNRQFFRYFPPALASPGIFQQWRARILLLSNSQHHIPQRLHPALTWPQAWPLRNHFGSPRSIFGRTPLSPPTPPVRLRAPVAYHAGALRFQQSLTKKRRPPFFGTRAPAHPAKLKWPTLRAASLYPEGPTTCATQSSSKARTSARLLADHQSARRAICS